MHAFHLAYFPLIIGGITLAWNGGRPGRVTPGGGFSAAITSMMLGFFLSYVWYPFLPGRGPWEHPAVMSGLRSFGLWIFTPVSELTFGLYATDRKASACFAALAIGLSVACVYTRYPHAVDVFAGLAVAAVAQCSAIA